MKYFKTFENYDSNKFYLAIDQYQKILFNDDFLNDHKLKGLIGISESEYIDNIVIPEIKIIMNKQEVLELNTFLEKLDYKNIDIFIKNDFKIYKRVDSDVSNINDLYRSLATYLDKNTSDEKYLKDIFMLNEKTFDNKKISDYTLPIFNNIKEFSNFICGLGFEYFEEDAIDDVYTILKNCFKKFSNSYEHEEEWLINSEFFEIPTSSKIEIYLKNIIKIHNIGSEEIQKIKDISTKLKMFTVIY